MKKHDGRKCFLKRVLIAGLALVGCSAAAGEYPPAGDLSRGAKLWAYTCVRCHNLRDPKELRDDQWISTMHHMRVRSGITGRDMRDILSFLQSSNKVSWGKVSKTSGPERGPLNGERIYSETCVACHGADGKGVLPGVPDFTRRDGRLAKSDDALLDSIRNGYRSPGSPMAMPPKGGNPDLGEADLKAVLEYLRERFGGR